MKLTAYALGELAGPEADEVEAVLARDASARRTVEEIRQLAGSLTRRLHEQEGPLLTDDRRAAVLSPGRPRGALRFWAPLAAAAALLIAALVGWMIWAPRDDRQRPGVETADEKPAPKPPPRPRGRDRPKFAVTPGHDDSMHISTPPPLEERISLPMAGSRVARGRKNLARGRAVTSSCGPMLGQLAWITDGNTWPYDGEYVELSRPGPQWVQIDLGESVEIGLIVVRHYHFADRQAYHDVVVRVSDDSTFKVGARTLYNNDRDNSAGLGPGRDREYAESGQGLVICSRGVRARYVRLYGNGSTACERNQYIEVEVYAPPAE